MQKIIRNICKNIEKEYKIKILFAVENGSRAWRMHSKDSDYDIRFVFVRPLKEYIQINNMDEVINISFDNNLKRCKSEGALIDISGFDIFKFTRLLATSNPTCIEWLVSDIVYYGEQNKVMKNFAVKNFNKIKLYFHYKSLCRNNYLKYLKTKNLVTYKKYLYTYRGLINAKWVAHKKTIPPIIFSEALDGMKNIIPSDVINKLHEIIKLKSEGKEKDIVENIVKLDQYAEKFLKDDSEINKNEIKPKLDLLNKELQKIVLETFK